MPTTDDWKSRPLIWLERRPLRRRRMQDEVSRQYLCKGDDIYLFRYYMSKERPPERTYLTLTRRLPPTKKNICMTRMIYGITVS